MLQMPRFIVPSIVACIEVFQARVQNRVVDHQVAVKHCVSLTIKTLQLPFHIFIKFYLPPKNFQFP